MHVNVIDEYKINIDSFILLIVVKVVGIYNIDTTDIKSN